MWSALTEQQLIERIWRFPQKKLVHIYRLIAEQSLDIFPCKFLGHIDYDGRVIRERFSNMGEKLSKCDVHEAGVQEEVG